MTLQAWHITDCIVVKNGNVAVPPLFSGHFTLKVEPMHMACREFVPATVQVPSALDAIASHAALAYSPGIFAHGLAHPETAVVVIVVVMVVVGDSVVVGPGVVVGLIVLVVGVMLMVVVVLVSLVVIVVVAGIEVVLGSVVMVVLISLVVVVGALVVVAVVASV